MTDLDEMLEALRTQERRLEAGLRLNARLARAVMLERTRAALGGLSRGLWLELVLLLLAAVVLGAFAARHAAELRFLAPAVALGACALGFAAATVRLLVALRELDHDQPVVRLQARLEALRLARARLEALALALGPLLWAPALLVLARGLLDVDLYARVSGAWLVANVLLGALVLGAAALVARRLGDRLEASPGLRRLTRALTGRELRDAEAALRELRELEQGASGAQA
ncbi:MAG: hypothetical protein M9894_12915 [Planctomycetes bacterium]|nr:hypothetical protein [Planctomycetota bacterium]